MIGEGLSLFGLLNFAKPNPTKAPKIKNKLKSTKRLALAIFQKKKSIFTGRLFCKRKISVRIRKIEI